MRAIPAHAHPPLRRRLSVVLPQQLSHRGRKDAAVTQAFAPTQPKIVLLKSTIPSCLANTFFFDHRVVKKKVIG